MLGEMKIRVESPPSILSTYINGYNEQRVCVESSRQNINKNDADDSLAKLRIE